MGEEADALLVRELLEKMLEAVRCGHSPNAAEVDSALAETRVRHAIAAENPAQSAAGGAAAAAVNPFADTPQVLRQDINIRPRTRGQKAYLEALDVCEMTIVIGPAGTGKTYLAMAAAVSALLNKKVRRLILTRPAVEAGESLGFLPGSLEQKVNPYLRPLYDALYSMVDMDRVRRLIDQQSIEVAPLAYMRGRSLDNAFVILDEAQNTTPDQMLMFLTRLGQGSRAVVTGDITQQDLPRGMKSGLVEAERILKNVPGIGIVRLSRRDVVRNPLVQRIVDAWEEHGEIPDGEKRTR
jgi:phosphate starvation-inducible protein PhoH and related proteins